jgi:hypothetical protein
VSEKKEKIRKRRRRRRGEKRRDDETTELITELDGDGMSSYSATDRKWREGVEEVLQLRFIGRSKKNNRVKVQGSRFTNYASIVSIHPYHTSTLAVDDEFITTS